jgi:hypothetical protein
VGTFDTADRAGSPMYVHISISKDKISELGSLLRQSDVAELLTFILHALLLLQVGFRKASLRIVNCTHVEAVRLRTSIESDVDVDDICAPGH